MSTSQSLLRASCASARPTTRLLPHTQCRFESTTRRHRKLLALPPSASYKPDSTSPTLVYNPPSSAPSAHHTPLKFLPPTDPRRNLYAAAQHAAQHASLASQTSPIAAPATPLHTTSRVPPRPSAALPPPVRPPYAKKYNIGPPQLDEMRALRAADPHTWTRVRLAERFGCSQFFVGLAAKNEDRARSVAREQQRAREKWGVRRREAREDRARRREAWGRDV